MHDHKFQWNLMRMEICLDFNVKKPDLLKVHRSDLGRN